MALRELITKNLGWKLAALLLAVVSWVMLNTGLQESLQPGAVRTFVELSVNLLTSATDTRTYRIEPAAVDVTVRGPTELMESLQPGDIEPYVSLTDLRENGPQSRRVRLSLPTGISRVRVRSEDVLVEILPEATASATTVPAP